MEKNIEYFKSLPYTRELIPEPEGGWFVHVKELPGCMSQGETPEEAMEMIADAMELWLETALDHGMAIPEPRMDEDYSGKFVVRLPKSLHRKCVEHADEDEVSLNQWVVSALSETIGLAWKKQTVRNKLKTQLPADYPEWPGLSDALIHILQDVGYDIEAGHYDEQLFVSWLGDCLAKIHHCLKSSDYEQALSCTQPLEDVLSAHQERSPVVSLLVHLVQEQSMLISQAQKLKERVLIEENRTAEIRALISSNYQSKVKTSNFEMDIIEKKSLTKTDYAMRETVKYPYEAGRYIND